MISLEILLIGISIVSLCLIFKKFNYKWWKALIPVYNQMIILKVAKLSIFYLFGVGFSFLSLALILISIKYDVTRIVFLLIFLVSVLFVEIIFQRVFAYRVSKRLNQSELFSVLSIFFPRVFLLIFALDKEEVKTEDKKKSKKDIIVLIINLIIICLSLMIIIFGVFYEKTQYTEYDCLTYNRKGKLIEDSCVTSTFDYQVKIINNTNLDITEEDLEFNVDKVKVRTSKENLENISYVEVLVEINEENINGEVIEAEVKAYNSSGHYSFKIPEITPEEVEVKVKSIKEDNSGKTAFNKRFENIPIEIYNLRDGYTASVASLEDTHVTVTVSGYVSREINESDITAYVDLSYYNVGTHYVKVEARVGNSLDNLNFALSKEVVQVIIKEE